MPDDIEFRADMDPSWEPDAPLVLVPSAVRMAASNAVPELGEEMTSAVDGSLTVPSGPLAVGPSGANRDWIETMRDSIAAMPPLTCLQSAGSTAI